MLGLVAVVLLFGACHATLVNISNVQPRLDSQKHILAAHDGNTVQFTAGGPFYFYGMSYGTCQEQGCGSGDCGFLLTHNITLYTTPDLASGTFTFQADVLPVADRPAGVYYRPKVVYNPNTKLYVLWVNWLPNRRDFEKSSYLAATSPTPQGPFKVQNSAVPLRYGIGGDFDLFVDTDGSGYIIYTSLEENHSISVEALSSDFLSSANKSSGLVSSGPCFEAPAMFKRDNMYVIIYGPCCCFCSEGSANVAYSSTSPLGPFMHAGDLGNPGHAQQNFVIQVPTPNGTEYIWTGDRWGSAPDKVIDHDFQYWAPLQFGPASRFIKSSGNDSIYWENFATATKHHVTSCDACSLSPCSVFETVAAGYIEGLSTGADFDCSVYQPYIRPLQSLASFVVDVA
eukprot:m.42209 g.42209  ORF g.42209 m.42209 type:complete len:398 (+) comp14319_c0_seq1:50-1243(+)